MNIPIKDASDATRKVDVFVRTEGADQVEMQAVAVVAPLTGTPIDFATQTTVAALLVAANAIKTAAEALNAKATAIDTGAIAGTVALDAPTLAALENTTVGGTVSVSNMVAQGLTDAQLRANPVGTVDSAVAALLATIAAATYLEDSPATNGDRGIFMLAQRRDADTATAADGDYTAINLDEAGRVKVATQPGSVASVTGNITANGQNVNIACGRFGNASVSMVATSLVGHNASFEASNNTTDGTDGTWYQVQAVRSNAQTVEIASGVLGATPVYMWHANVGDYLWFRVRATAHTSGTAAYILKPGSFATEPIPAVQVTGTQPVSLAALPALVAGTARAAFTAGAGIWYDDSSTVLAANATFTGSSRDLTVTATATAMANAATYAKEVRVSAESDQSGTLWVDFSRDATNWRRAKSAPTAAVTGGGQFAEIVFRPSWRYMRVGFTNGATLQVRFTIGSLLIAA